MFKKLKEILLKSKEDNCDLSIAHAKVRNDDRIAGITDYTDLDRAYKAINNYESVITKMWTQGDLFALENLCKLIEEENIKEINNLVQEWV